MIKPTMVTIRIETNTEKKSVFVSASMRINGQLTEDQLQLVDYKVITPTPKLVVFGNGESSICYPDMSVAEAMDLCKRDHPHLLQGSFTLRRIDAPFFVQGTIHEEFHQASAPGMDTGSDKLAVPDKGGSPDTDSGSGKSA
jgi:hypothetical protein